MTYFRGVFKNKRLNFPVQFLCRHYSTFTFGYLFIYLFIDIFIYVFIYLFIYLSIYLFIYLFIWNVAIGNKDFKLIFAETGFHYNYRNTAFNHMVITAITKNPPSPTTSSTFSSISTI